MSSGAGDLREHFNSHPEDVRMCAGLIRVLDVNVVSQRLFHAESKEELMSRFKEGFTPDSFRTLEENLIAIAGGSTASEGELLVRTLLGEIRTLYMRALRVPDYRDASLRVLVIFVDITERKMILEALRANEEKYRRLVEGSPDIVYSYSSKRGGIFYSSRVQSVLGYSPSHMCQNPNLWCDSIHPDDVDRVKKVIESFDPGRSIDVEYRIRDSKGQWHWMNDRSIDRQVLGDEVITGGLTAFANLKMIYQVDTGLRSLISTSNRSLLRITRLYQHPPS